MKCSLEIHQVTDVYRPMQISQWVCSFFCHQNADLPALEEFSRTRRNVGRKDGARGPCSGLLEKWDGGVVEE